MNKSILTVGSLAFDTVQTPSGKAEKALGGSVNYFSVAASFFSPLKVIGVVGEDFPVSHLDWLSKRGIDVSGVEITKGQTFHWVGQYDQNLNEAKTLSTFLNVFEHFKPTLQDHHRNTPYVFLANMDPDLQMDVLNQVKDPQFIACDSMNFWITGKPDALKKILRRIDLLSINEGEAFLLSGQNNIISAAQAIRDMGPQVVVIKRGEYGSMLFGADGIFIAPAYPVTKVVDPTGAGDSFAGAMIGYLAHKGISRDMAKHDPKQFNHLIRQAVLQGSVMASFTVEDFSLHRLMRLEKAELDQRYQQLKHMIAVE